MSVVTLNRRELQASLGRLRQRVAREPQKIAGELRPAFQAWGDRWARGVQSRFESGGLKSRSGALKRSIKFAVAGSTLDDLRLRMSSEGDLVYAKVQEFGGVIRPKNGKFLTIPTSFNKTPGGSTRFPSARALISQNPKDTFFAKSKAGNLLLWWNKPNKAVRKSAGQDGAVPMFVLKESVELPGPLAPTKRRASRLGFYDTWNAQKAARSADLVRIGLGAA